MKAILKKFMGNVLAGMLGSFMAFGLMLAFCFFIITGIVMSLAQDKELVYEDAVLRLSFDTPISEQSSVQPDMIKFSLKSTLGLKAITDAIKSAKEDDQIRGIYLDLASLQAGFASVQELRNALIDFKKSEKFIVAHADSYTHGTYYLASVADELYLTPEGSLEFSGLSADIVFFKSMLAKIGIEPVVIRHGKFKSAVEPFLQDEISEANEKQTRKYVQSLWNTLIEGISEQRDISVEQLNEMADKLSIRNSATAKSFGLVDELKYKDEVFASLKTQLELDEDEKITFVELGAYAKNNKSPLLELEKKPEIALIYAEGDIHMGKSTQGVVGSDTLAKAIRTARENDDVKAIVLRVNSPGGSALASEVIWREASLAQKVKPLIVSFGNVAASGGYYIACAADEIVAEPNTITGSIGVFGLMFNAEELMTTLGMNTHTVKSNTYSDIMNPTRKMTVDERAIIQTSVEEVYDTFISHVAEGRKMEKSAVDAIAQGRVWTGIDAKEIGLVDTIGGLNTSLVSAAKKAKLTDYSIVTYPAKDEYERMIKELLGEVKASVIEEELGSSSPIYQRFKKVQRLKGVQVRLPFFLEVH